MVVIASAVTHGARHGAVGATALCIFLCAASPPARADGDPASDTGWWTPRYLVDYGIIAAAGAGALVGDALKPRSPALIGPAYDPDDPGAIFGSEVVDEPHLDKGTASVPGPVAAAGVGAGLLGVAAIETIAWRGGDGSARRAHDTFVGALEAVAVTGGLTNLTKVVVGRLRPDFADRARRYHCAGAEPVAACEGYAGEPLAADRAEALEILDDGRRSFFSGHSSHAFNAFAYASLAIGGRYVWGEGATTASRVGGAGLQSALLGLALYTSGSRIGDGRHHPTDVVAGALVGAIVANVAYWRRFDASGEPRPRGAPARARVSVAPLARGAGLALSLRY